MCGITGFVDPFRNTSETVLRNMTDALIHRGPDGSGLTIRRVCNSTVGLGHRRLAILDMSNKASQPMMSNDQSTLITFNGEIYNFNEIKVDLEKAGCHFVTSSDTEVILQAYKLWGIDCLRRFRGMFAFALLDEQSSKLYLVRDRAGVKPLYYYSRNGLILFASELKSLHQHGGFEKELSTSSVSQFLEFGCITKSNTIFKNTHKIPPGNYLTIDLKSNLSELKSYWDVYDSYNKPKFDMSYTETINKAEEVLTESFELRMISDVPVGIFLSGGYDSTVVTALLQKSRDKKLKTFTIGTSDKALNEANYAKTTSDILGTDHHELYVDSQDAKNLIEKLPFFYDEPFFDYSAIPTMLVSMLARNEVTVALSGDGGDEIFAGYARHVKMLKDSNPYKLTSSILAKGVAKVANHLPTQFLKQSQVIEIFRKFDNIAPPSIIGNRKNQFVRGTLPTIFTQSEIRHLLKLKFSVANSVYSELNKLDFGDNLDRILATDYKTYMVDDILVKVDRASMSVSLEAREPFLDQRIIEFAARIPSDYKIKDGVQKSILKDIVHKYVPSEHMNRPKTGFAIPMAKWLHGDLNWLINQYLDRDTLERQGIFNYYYISFLKEKFLLGDFSIYNKIWTLICFQMWYEKWMKESI